MNKIVYSDNIRVATTRYGHEYFKVFFVENPDEFMPFEVAIERYCVPGRCNTYFLYKTLKHDIVISEEGHVNVIKILSILHKDLEKEQVVNLLVEACKKHRYYAYRLEPFLGSIAPKSKSYRKVKAIVKKYKDDYDKTH